MANYYRPHYGYHGRPVHWGGHGAGRVYGLGHSFGHGFPGHGWGHTGRDWGHGWGGHHWNPAGGWRHGYGRRWPWLYSGAGSSADPSWAEQCLAQLFGPGALQDPQQAIRQFQAQQ